MILISFYKLQSKAYDLIAVIGVESVVKYSFVLKGMQTGRKGQYNAELTLSPNLCIKPLITAMTAIDVACVASVSVGFGSKERTRNRIFGVLSVRKMGRGPKKKKEGDGRGEGRKCLQTNPWILKTSIRQRTELVIG